MKAQAARNFVFFDAPVGIIFTIDRRLEIGSWLDYGMFLQNVMLAARAQGLETCPQAAFANYHGVIREVLGLDETKSSSADCRSASRITAPSSTRWRPTVRKRADFATFRGF